jgi:excisionase family DNA binding protein
MNPYLTPTEAGQILRVHRRTVCAWIRSGKLRAANLGTPTRPLYRISRAACDAMIAQHPARPEPQPEPPRPSRRRRERLLEVNPDPYHLLGA